MYGRKARKENKETYVPFGIILLLEYNIIVLLIPLNSEYISCLVKHNANDIMSSVIKKPAACKNLVYITPQVNTSN